MWGVGAVGDKEQGGILWLGSCKHPSQCGRPEAKARPCVQCCRQERSSDMPAFSLWVGDKCLPGFSTQSQPLHPTVLDLDRNLSVGTELLKGAGLTREKKRALPTWKHQLPFYGALDPSTRPQEAPGGLGKSSFYSSVLGNHQKPQRLALVHQACGSREGTGLEVFSDNLFKTSFNEFA